MSASDEFFDHSHSRGRLLSGLGLPPRKNHIAENLLDLLGRPRQSLAMRGRACTTRTTIKSMLSHGCSRRETRSWRYRGPSEKNGSWRTWERCRSH